jgi:hypothetical protein
MTLAATPFRAPACVGLLVSAIAWAGCAGSLADPAAFSADTGDAGAPANVDADASAASCPDVPTLLAATCGSAGCHDATTKAESLDLVSSGVAARLIGVPSVEGTGLLIAPSTPSQSVVYTKLLATPPFGARMPTGNPLDAAHIQCVLDWVTTEAASMSSGADSGAPPGPEAGVTGDAAASDTGSVSPFVTLRVAAGQMLPVTDAQGQTWSADTGYTGGTPDVATSPVTIAGTDSPALYNGQRYGNPTFSYAFDVPDGNYTVTLRFAELYVTGPGMRLFGIAINATTVETSFDIYAAAGAMNTAVDESYPVTVSGGKLEIDFTQGSVQVPKIDAIQIAQASAGDGGS